MSPEILKKHFHINSDVWSCGVILHILLSGYPPFCGRDENEIMLKVKTGSYSLKAVEWKNITKEGKRLIDKMLVADPNHRYSVSQCLKD